MTIVDVTINKAHGFDTKYLFPGSVAHSGALSFANAGNGRAIYGHTVHVDGKAQAQFSYLYGPADSNSPQGDLHGNFWHWDLYKANTDKVLASVNITTDAGASTAVNIASYANLTPNALIGSIYATGQVPTLRFFGNNGADTLRGSDGADQFWGGKGGDRMMGEGGNDTYGVDSKHDQVVERANGGSDIVYTEISYTLGKNVEHLVATGNREYHLTGNRLANGITGGINDDTIKGLGGADYLDGAEDKDKLYGGEGKDAFIFRGVPPASDADVIMDFKPSADTIWLNRTGFGATVNLPTQSFLPADFFHASKKGKAHYANDFFNYDKDDGRLYYDPDGNGAAHRALIATFAHDPKLTAADFFIIA